MEDVILFSFYMRRGHNGSKAILLKVFEALLCPVKPLHKALLDRRYRGFRK